MSDNICKSGKRNARLVVTTNGMRLENVPDTAIEKGDDCVSPVVKQLPVSLKLRYVPYKKPRKYTAHKQATPVIVHGWYCIVTDDNSYIITDGQLNPKVVKFNLESHAEKALRRIKMHGNSQDFLMGNRFLSKEKIKG